MSLWILLLFFVPHQGTASALCHESIRVSNLTNDPSFCIREATRLNPSVLMTFSDGSCRLLNACPEPNSRPIFARLRPGRPYLLMRTHTNTTANPYNVFSKGEPDAVQRSLHSLTPTGPYKSPLFDMSGESPEFLSLLLLNETGAVDVNLTFKTVPGKPVSSPEAWFKKKNLVSARPWKKELLLKEGVTFTATSVLRPQSFVISVKKDACDFVAFMLVFEGKTISCSWEGVEKDRPAYYWGIQDGEAAHFKDEKFARATQFVIEGIFRNTKDKVYVRVKNQID